MDMADGNSAALKLHEASEARRESFLDRAEAKRAELVESLFLDESGKNDAKLRDVLADLAGGDPEFLHSIQRGGMVGMARLQKLFLDALDFTYGDDLVDAEAEQIEQAKRCTCRGDCTC